MFRRRERPDRRDQEKKIKSVLKCVILGSDDQLIKELFEDYSSSNRFSQSHLMTIGFEPYFHENSFTIGNFDYLTTLNIWHINSEQNFETFKGMYFRAVTGVILFINVDDDEDFEIMVTNLKVIVEENKGVRLAVLIVVHDNHISSQFSPEATLQAIKIQKWTELLTINYPENINYLELTSKDSFPLILDQMVYNATYHKIAPVLTNRTTETIHGEDEVITPPKDPTKEKILSLLFKTTPGIPVQLSRLIELAEIDDVEFEDKLKEIIMENHALGEYHQFEQVFVRKVIVVETAENDRFCLKCGSEENTSENFCSNCEANFEQCQICRQFFSSKDKISPCKNCQNFYHYNHIYALVQAKGECPICHSALKLQDLEPISNNM